MHVGFHIDRGFYWTDVVSDHVKIKPLVKKHGQAGIFYLIYFALPFSPYGFEPDFEERDRLVLEHLAETDFGGKGGKVKSKSTFPPKFYEEKDFETGRKALRGLGIGPRCFWEMQSLVEDEYRYQNDLNKRTWIDDPDKRLKELSADEKAYNVLEKVRKQLREVEELITKRFAPNCTILSMDDILSEV